MENQKAEARYGPMLTLLAKVLGKKVSEIEPMLDDAAKIDELSELAADAIEDARVAGETKIRTMLGTALKKEGLDLRVDKINAAFVTTIKEHFTPKIDEDDKGDSATTLSKARKEIEDLKTQLVTKETEIVSRMAEKDKEIDHKKIELDVQGRAKDALAKLNANVPADEKIAGKKFQRLLREISENNYQWSEKDQDYVLVEENGEVVRGENKLPVKLQDWFAESIAVNYGLRTVDQKDSGNLPDKGGDKPVPKYDKYKGPAPKTEDEYLAKINDPMLSLDQKLEIDEVWSASPESKVA